MKPPEESTGLDLPQNGNPSAITPRLTLAIAARFSPERICDEIEKLFAATLHNGQPDVRAIEAGLKLALAYTEGLPLQRQEIKEYRLTGTVDPVQLITNPATQATLVSQAVAAGVAIPLVTALMDAIQKAAKPAAGRAVGGG